MKIIETEVSRSLKGLPHNNYPSRIVLHHAEATSCSIEDIDRWHKANGWQGIGYHYFIRKNGEIYKGRPDYTMGAHCLHNNTNTIGICAEGKYMTEIMPEVQKQAIISLCKSLGIRDIKGHRELNSTDCPGVNYPLEDIRNVVLNGQASIYQSQHQPISTVTIDTSVRDKVGYVTADALNVRYTANGNIIGQLRKGDKVTLWNKEGNWYHIYSPVNGYNQAYVSCDYIKIGSNTVSNSKYGIVTASVLNVRNGAGTDYNVIGQLNKGAKVKIDKKIENWYSIYFGNHGGFVSADYIRLV